MNDLTPSFERETGQVIIEGLPAGVAGEAPLVPVPGLDLAFDRVDGRLCRAVVDAAGPDGSIAVGEQAAAILIRLFGAEAMSVVAGALEEASPEASALSPEPDLAGSLSRLARADAARVASPIPPGSPWWAAEAAELADRAGLPARARAEARRALPGLLGQLDSPEPLSSEAIRAALAVARIAAADEPDAARQLRDTIGPQSGSQAGPAPGPRPAARTPEPALDVAAEVESLEKDRVRLRGLHWMLDPGLVPEGLFRLGLSPYSDLLVRPEGAKGRVIVEALLAPEADCGALTRCQARLVDPAVRRILARTPFTREQSRARAKLELTFPLDELPESWIEVVQDQDQPVRSAKGHRVRRALRWADAALRAERAPAGLAPQSTGEDWAALAGAAWERCRRDWEAADDADRAYLAARRQAAVDPRTCVPEPPSAAAADIARQVPIDGPAYLAETLGRLARPRAPGPAIAVIPGAQRRIARPAAQLRIRSPR